LGAWSIIPIANLYLCNTTEQETTMSMTRQQALQKARELFQSRIAQGGDFPEDDWVGIDRRWDLNLFTEAGKPRASIYPVDDTGCTDTFGEIPVPTAQLS
jgi:hypothetical protein